MEKTLARESYGPSGVSKSYISNSQGQFEVIDNTKRLTSISQFFRSVFLPQGYPESVSTDYLQYQIWDTVQAFASSITGSLATQAVLKGVGVGDESATVLAATMTWLMKDGTGMVGRIVFAWMQGTYLDSDCKRWRLFADILNDLAMFLEILAPFFKTYFTFIICVAGVGKSIVGVAGGATRAALTQHQARRNNMADVSAKDGSQETLVNLAGLLCNLLLIPMVTDKHMLIWTLFFLFTTLHLYANFCAVTSVVMETFNQARLHIVMKKYLRDTTLGLMSIKETNRSEPVVWKTRRRLTIKLGVSLRDIISSRETFEKLAKIYAGEKYILSVKPKTGKVDVCLRGDSGPMDHLRACYQAEVLEFAVTRSRTSGISPRSHQLHNVVEAVAHNDVLSMLAQSHKFMESTFGGFVKLAETQGWKLDPVLLCADEWRADWDLIDGLDSKKSY